MKIAIPIILAAGISLSLGGNQSQDPRYLAGSSCVSPFLAASRGNSAGRSLNRKGEVYPDCGVITKIRNGMVFITMQNGNVFKFADEAGDWCIGDLVAVMLNDNGTAKVSDDSVVRVKYSGWISKKEMKAWVKKGD